MLAEDLRELRLIARISLRVRSEDFDGHSSVALDTDLRGGRCLSYLGREGGETLIRDQRIPADRHVVYALELLAGVRPGETAALRWRHYDPTAAPLGKLLVATSYNTRKHRTKLTKTNTVKHVPVHPTLAAMLAEWKLSGWAAMMGQAPGPDDLIVPLPPAAAAARRSRTGEAFRGHDYSGKRWRDDDLPALGWRHRRHYDMRATFITLALEDGADPDVIKTRVTHTKKSRSAFDGDNRGTQWEATCREVAKLRISRGRVAIVVAVGADSPSAPYKAMTATVTSENETENWWRRRESNQLDRSFSTSTCPILRDNWYDRFPPAPSRSTQSGSGVAARCESGPVQRARARQAKAELGREPSAPVTSRTL